MVNKAADWSSSIVFKATDFLHKIASSSGTSFENRFTALSCIPNGFDDRCWQRECRIPLACSPSPQQDIWRLCPRKECSFCLNLHLQVDWTGLRVQDVSNRGEITAGLELCWKWSHLLQPCCFHGCMPAAHGWTMLELEATQNDFHWIPQPKCCLMQSKYSRKMQ